MKFEIENLKILISTWFNKVIFKQRIVINDNLFLREKILNDIPYDDIINAGDFGALAAALGRTVYGPVIEGVLESKSLFQIGVALDRYYYHALYMSSNMLPGNSRLMARRFFGTTVDFENLICQLRYRRMRFNASNNYNEYFIEGGRLVTVNNIDEVTANEASVKTFLENTFSGSYSERGEEGGDIIELVEHTRNEELYHIARAFLAMQPDSIATLIAYFLIMHREHMQVITVLQSHYYNLDEEKTREALCL
jgi:vacuolar-type H+-ATPase subunit C/Vma6